MTARLIAATKPVDPEFGNTAQEFIAYVARVSNPGNQWNHATAKKLCDYLEREKHWSPFEMFNVVIEIETTRDIARQMLRHPSLRPQEFSQRYALVTDMFSEPKEARLQDSKNRQNSLEIDDEQLQEQWEFEQRYVSAIAQDAYNWAIENGIAKECARVVLPEGLTLSRLYMNGNIRSWMHYLSVRLDKSTQKEHREVALEIEKIVRGVLENG